MRSHGVDYRRRRDILREKVLLMKSLWTADDSEFKGEFVSLEKSWAWPKPTQKPHPQIIMGGAIGSKTADTVAEFCDGWMPVNGLYDIDGGPREIANACARRGRDPQPVGLGVFGAQPDRDELRKLADAGSVRAILLLPSEERDAVLPLLDQYARLLD